MSTLRVTGLKQETSNATNISMAVGGGVTVAGIATFHNNAIFTNDVTVTGNISVGGTLTYQDVTDVDSIGIITARSGLDVTGGNVFIGDNSDRTSFLTATTNNLQIDGGVIFEPESGNDVELYNYRTTAIKIGTGGSEKLRITSAGSVGIGITNPEDYNSEADDLVIGSGGADTGITLVCGTGAGSHGSIFFADGIGSSGAKKKGQIRYEQNNEIMSFHTNEQQRLTIDLNGNIGIGTDNPLVPFVLSHDGNKNIEMGYSDGGSFPSHYLQAYNRGTSAYAPLSIAGSETAFFIGSTEKMRIHSDGAITTPTNPYSQWKISCNVATHVRTLTEYQDRGSNVTSELAGNGSSHGNVGRFTAPVTGAYLFTITSTGRPANTSELLVLYGSWTGSTTNSYPPNQEIIDTRGAAATGNVLQEDGASSIFTLYLAENDYVTLDWYRTNTLYLGTTIYTVSATLLG